MGIKNTTIESDILGKFNKIQTFDKDDKLISGNMVNLRNIKDQSNATLNIEETLFSNDMD
jgi:hypothetical protein